MRIESEFYNSESMHYHNYKKGKDVVIFSQYGTSKDLNEVSCGYPVLRLNEFNYSFISAPAKYCNLIDESTYQDLKLKEGDVLICRTNGNPKYVGRSALVAKDYNYAFASYLFRVRPNTSLISPATLVAYLNCKYGRIEIERYSMVSNQANFSPAKFREINIPIFPKSLINNVDILTYTAFEKLEKSEKLYASAEEELIKHLGLGELPINPETINVKSFKKSFLYSGRLDAEYYQTKFDNLFELLSKFKCDALNNLVDIEKSIEPGSEAYQDKGIPFVRVQDLSKFGISETDVYLSPKDYSNVIRPKKDTILLSKDGSVGVAYKVESDSEYITSGAILHLAIKDERVLPDYLTLVLNSIVVRMQAERDAGGSIIQHWKPSEIEKVIIPILPYEIQEKISDIVKHSFELRKEAKNLLYEAKQLVEGEITMPEGKVSGI